MMLRRACRRQVLITMATGICRRVDHDSPGTVEELPGRSTSCVAKYGANARCVKSHIDGRRRPAGRAAFDEQAYERHRGSAATR